MVLLAAIDIAAAQPKRILLLHSFGPNFGPWNVISARLREELRTQSPYTIDLYENSLQGDRFGEKANERPFLDYLNGLFQERGLDLIVAMGAPAARFALRNRPEFFPLYALAHCGSRRADFRRQSTHCEGNDRGGHDRSFASHRRHPPCPS